MEELRKIEKAANDRVKQAINVAMNLYLNKLDTGYYSIGLENSFQMHLANEIQIFLDSYTFYPEERFVVHFEKNMPINGNKDYVDIVIQYTNQNFTRMYLIELKFKKITDSAPDLGNLESYIDIYNLDSHKQHTENVANCYYIFLTDYETYTKQSDRGTRTEIPMYDGYKIVGGENYQVSGDAAKKASQKYPTGFTFSQDYDIVYKHFLINEKNYWFYILEI